MRYSGRQSLFQKIEFKSNSSHFATSQELREKHFAYPTNVTASTIIPQRNMAIVELSLRIRSVNNRILLTKYVNAYKNISLQLARYVHLFPKCPSGPKVALDFKYNFILSVAIFPLSEAMPTMATTKSEP